MKCANCGSEIKLGSVYCASCGKEAFIVPDYNPAEDEVFLDLGEDDGVSGESQPDETPEKPDEPKNETVQAEKKPRKKLKKSNIFALVAIASVIILIVGVVAVRRSTSYEYQYDKAYSYFEKAEYENAKTYVNRCINLDDTRTDSYILLAKIYFAEENDDEAVAALGQALELDPECDEAYEMLLSHYEESKDYESIIGLRDSVSDEIREKYFSDYIIAAPTADTESGSFGDDITVKLSAGSKYDIYYTVDGSDPVKDGIKYDDYYGVTITEGSTTLKAVAIDSRGVYSDTAEYEYVVEYEALDMPTVSPDGGTFTSQSYVTITVPAGCTAYYNWSNTTPTTSSNVYSSPIAIPEGNNVLSVVLVDSHGLYSAIYRGNFVYYP